MNKCFISIVCAFMICACATQSQQTTTEGTAIGCAGGAIVGGLLGWAISGDATGAAIGAGAGGLAGCTGGYLYADNLNKRHQELAGKEQDLDAQIQFAKGVSNDTQQQNRMLATKISEFDQKVSALKAKTGKQKTISKELAAEKKKINEELKNARNGLAIAERDLNNSKAFRSTQSTPSPELDAEITRLENNLAELRKNSNALAALSQRI